MGEGALTNGDVMELLGDKVGYGSYKTYRVLDSLDGVPLDKRIPLSEWIPPIGVDVNFIHNGDFDRGQIQCIDKHGIIVKWRGLACVFESDGHWMRIV